MEINIEKKLGEAGYQLLGDSKNIEKLILDILKTENIRYLKAIPFIIYKHHLDINQIYKANKNTKSLFTAIITITKKIFQELNIKKNLLEFIPSNSKDTEIYTKKKLINYEEFKAEFELQLRNSTKPDLFIEKQKIYAERDLQMQLSQLFTKKEKHIIKRLLNEKPISRTDYEYYSRKTKKKIASIIGLQDFAKTIYSKTPEYDKELYSLKKKLEEWLEKSIKEENISIMKFFLWNKDEISISYTKKTDLYSENQFFKSGIKLTKIKDINLLKLIKKYKEHDFR